MNYKNYLPLLLLFSICWTACNKKTTEAAQAETDTVKKGATTTATKTAPLEGTWSVVNFPVNGKPFMPKKFYKITFDGRNMGLKLDVNNCGSAYTNTDNTITLTDEVLSCTEACCDSKDAQILARLFKGSMKYTITKNILTITSKEGNIKLSNIQSSLQGTSWLADNYNDLKEGRPISFEKEYILTFEPKSLQLRLDANNCNTSYTFDESAQVLELPVQNMACTRKCCDSEDGILLMRSLQGKISYTRTGNKLTLKTNNKEIRFTLFDPSNKE